MHYIFAKREHQEATITHSICIYIFSSIISFFLAFLPLLVGKYNLRRSYFLDLCRLAQACSTMVARFKGFLLDLSYRSFILIGPIRAEYRTIIPNGLKKLSPDCRNKAQNDMGFPTLSSSVPRSLFFWREDLPQGGLSHSRRPPWQLLRYSSRISNTRGRASWRSPNPK
jgi:hypothetical protein